MYNYYHFFHFLRNRELNEIYASVAIRSFALSMISVFIPIYLLNLGYPLRVVFIFFAVVTGVHALFAIPASRISSRYGFKHSIFFSVPLLILFFIMLFTLELYNWSLPFIAVIFGLSKALFWTGYHVDFSKFSKKKSRGEEIGFSKILSSVFSMLGPLIGGLILVYVSFKLLFVVVSLLLLVSTFPLFFSRDIHDPINFSVKQIFKDQTFKEYLAHFGYGVEKAVMAVVWPIFIFTAILNNLTSLGFVTSLSMFSSLVFIFVIGKFSDKNRRLVLRLGAFFNAVIWGIKTLAKTALHVFTLDFFHGITRTAISIPFDAIDYDKANRKNIVETIVFREMFLNMSSMLLFIFLIFVSDYIVSFIVGAGSSLLLWFF